MKNIPKHRVREWRERAHGLYLAGLIAGKQAAIQMRRPTVPENADSSWLSGYEHGYNGMATALRNEAAI